MQVDTLQVEHVPRVTRRILSEAGLPTEGMTRVLVSSILVDEVGSTIKTSANGHWVIDIEEDTRILATQAKCDEVAVKTHILTMNLVKGLLGENYSTVVRKSHSTSSGVDILEVHLLPDLPELLN